ncbi:MAG: hypothetical protein WCP39_07545 [Chlamydiota bacterium]
MKWLWILFLFIHVATYSIEPTTSPGVAASEGKKTASRPMAWTCFSLSFLVIVGIGVTVAICKDHHHKR